MSYIYDTDDRPVEIAPGRGDLRFSSMPYGIRQDSGQTSLIGRSISYSRIFATQPWVATAVMRLLTWSVRVPLKCYRREAGGEERVQLQPDEHPLARICKRPWLGTDSNPAALVQALLGPLLVHGNSVTLIETLGGEDYLRPLDWRYLQPLGTTSGQTLIGWQIEDDGRQPQGDPVPLANTVHCAWWSPLGPLGISPLEQLGVTVKIEDAAQRYQQAIFQNGARPPSAVTTTTEFLALEEAERSQLLDQLREDVTELYAGPENQGRPALLPPGLDWKQIGHSAVEAELISQREVAREEVAAVYQIPPPMIGILKDATYSNIETQKDMAYTMALNPYLTMIEQIMTSTLARDHFGDDDVYVEFDYGQALRGNRQEEITAFSQAIGTGLNTMNEGRRALNLPPSDEPDADRLFYPANNLKPVGDAEAEAAKAQAQQLELQKAKQTPPPGFEEEKPSAPDELKVEVPGFEMIGYRKHAGQLIPVLQVRDESKHPHDKATGRFKKVGAPDGFSQLTLENARVGARVREKQTGNEGEVDFVHSDGVTIKWDAGTSSREDPEGFWIRDED